MLKYIIKIDGIRQEEIYHDLTTAVDEAFEIFQETGRDVKVVSRSQERGPVGHWELIERQFHPYIHVGGHDV